MIGLINKSIEGFLRQNYGDAVWVEIAMSANVDQHGFLDLSSSDGRITRKILMASARRLGKLPSEVIEDLGAWLVRLEPVRRLLRFSGNSFHEFVTALDELPGRTRLVLPAMSVPSLSVKILDANTYLIGHDEIPSGWVWGVSGVLRGMADDYGALVIINVCGNWVTLTVASSQHSRGRPFTLSWCRT